MQRVVRWALVAILLAGCTLGTRTPDRAVDLAARLAEAQTAQAAALALWDRVIFGETVACTESIPAPALVQVGPDAAPDVIAVQTQINAAIRAIRNSSDLWNIECADAREAVPLELAREGRANALAAADPLAEAARLLADLNS